MKKLILSAVVLLSAVASLSAQTQPQNSSNQSQAYSQSYSWGEGWFVNVAGGAEVYFGDHNRQLLKRTSLISPAADLSFGKWFNPYIAARASFSGFRINGATQESYIMQDKDGRPIHVDARNGYQFLFKQRFDYMNLHADLMVNVSNLFGDAEKVDQHKWNCSPYVGLGFPYVLSTNGKSMTAKGAIPLSVNAGIYNAFPISDKLDVILDARAVLVDDNFDGESGGRWLEGILSMNFGISYKF